MLYNMLFLKVFFVSMSLLLLPQLKPQVSTSFLPGCLASSKSPPSGCPDDAIHAIHAIHSSRVNLGAKSGNMLIIVVLMMIYCCTVYNIILYL